MPARLRVPADMPEPRAGNAVRTRSRAARLSDGAWSGSAATPGLARTQGLRGAPGGGVGRRGSPPVRARLLSWDAQRYRGVERAIRDRPSCQLMHVL
ncbi:hypothetical protein GCM10010517_79330 [Streptosporangium fragile]|uniref:Uncharacterized protein n=1 Tax=Streptosporangium fragile TaxID=46186 RepID=A0ABN3WFS2_9ACTN